MYLTRNVYKHPSLLGETALKQPKNRFSVSHSAVDVYRSRGKEPVQFSGMPTKPIVLMLSVLLLLTTANSCKKPDRLNLEWRTEINTQSKSLNDLLKKQESEILKQLIDSSQHDPKAFLSDHNQAYHILNRFLDQNIQPNGKLTAKQNRNFVEHLLFLAKYSTAISIPVIEDGKQTRCSPIGLLFKNWNEHYKSRLNKKLAKLIEKYLHNRSIVFEHLDQKNKTFQNRAYTSALNKSIKLETQIKTILYLPELLEVESKLNRDQLELIALYCDSVLNSIPWPERSFRDNLGTLPDYYLFIKKLKENSSLSLVRFQTESVTKEALERIIEDYTEFINDHAYFNAETLNGMLPQGRILYGNWLADGTFAGFLNPYTISNFKALPDTMPLDNSEVPYISDASLSEKKVLNLLKEKIKAQLKFDRNLDSKPNQANTISFYLGDECRVGSSNSIDLEILYNAFVQCGYRFEGDNKAQQFQNFIEAFASYNVSKNNTYDYDLGRNVFFRTIQQ